MSRIERLVTRVRSLPGLKQIDKRRYRRIFAQNRTVNMFYGVFQDFAEARRHMPATKPEGYDHQNAAAMYGGPVQQVRLVDYPILYWLSRMHLGGKRLFDYGGHIGLRYYGLRRLLALPDDFVWTVWDVAAVMREGRRIAAENDALHLAFTDDVRDAQGADIFLASGSLQYFEEILPETLHRLNAHPEHVLINEMPLHAKHEFATINNMTTAFCTYKVFNKDRFLTSMDQAGYRLLDIWQSGRDKRCSIPFHEEHSSAIYYGMYFAADPAGTGSAG